jgi:hypothetical protein
MFEQIVFISNYPLLLFHKKKKINIKTKEIPFREDFPCYSTWKGCKHSEHFSRFRIIIGNFCIINQKCYVLYNKIRSQEV